MAYQLRGDRKINNMKTGSINVQTENIFPIIKKFLYTDNELTGDIRKNTVTQYRIYVYATLSHQQDLTENVKTT